MQAHVYIRFSSPKQERGDSRERQLHDCLAYCERNGWELAGPPMEDLGLSAWKGHHLSTGELGRFADRVRAGEIAEGDILVCEGLDRLSRLNPRMTQRWLEEMTDLGLRIATVKGNRIYDRASLESSMIDIIEILMHARLNHEHSANISDKLQKSWVRRFEAAKAGKVISAHLPGWLRTEGEGDARRIVQIPERVALVREIYQMAADGIGARRIATILNQRGVAPWGRRHHHKRSTVPGWEHTYIADILRSAAVEGDYEPGKGRSRSRPKTGERFVGYFGEPIVDADLIARARANVASRKGSGGRHRARQSNLFQGLFRCGGCGGKMAMRGSATKPARYLECVNVHSGRGCYQRGYFNYQNFEKAALAAMLPLALDDRFFRRPDQTHALAVALAEANKALTDKSAELDRIGDLLIGQLKDSPALIQRFADAEGDLRALEAKRADVSRKLDAARGAVSPQEHLQRVLLVQDALLSEDEVTRLAARLKVSEAIRTVVDSIECIVSATSGRGFVMSLGSGAHVFCISNEGEHMADFPPPPGEGSSDWSDGRTPEEVARVDAYFRRSTAAA